MFWNLNKKDLSNLVCEAAKELDVDVVALIESGVTSMDMLNALSSNVSTEYYAPVATTGRFQIFSRDNGLSLNEIYAGNRISIRKITNAGTELLLGFVHLVDKGNFDSKNQLVQASLLVNEIKATEDKKEHTRTIIIGDFNMNPFDQIMNVAGGMNAMMTKQCVKSGGRTVQDVNYKFFYNPMWSLFGDRTPGSPGTFYHNNSNKGHFGWNMPDQVLLRQDAIPWFDNVRIITDFGKTQLITNLGRPKKNTSSDHLPLLVTLK